jgi:glycosyl transferase family 25
MFPGDKVYTRICHLKAGHEDREKHILREFSRRGAPANFYTDWDQSDISESLRSTLVSSPDLSAANVSLTMKHVGIWREFLKTKLPFCLVFENDVFLAPDFNAQINRCLTEFGNEDRKAVVYLGNGGNYYTPTSALVEGRHLYPASHSRCTDSYLITRPTAEARVAWFDANKFDRPIDHQVEIVDQSLGVEMLWFERPIVEQGSQNGTFKTTVQQQRLRNRWVTWLAWNFKKYRRRRLGRTVN